MGYGYRGGRRGGGVPLTPPAELVGRMVRWSPKRADGKRGAAVFGTVVEFDAEARVLCIEVQKEMSPWSPEPTRLVRVPLSSGPFTPIN